MSGYIFTTNVLSATLFIIVVVSLIPEFRNFAITKIMSIVNRAWIYMKSRERIETLQRDPSNPDFNSSSLSTSSSLNRSFSSTGPSSPVKSGLSPRVFQTLELDCQVKDHTQFIYHKRLVKLKDCKLFIYKKDKLTFEFNFTGGKVMESRTPNAIKIVAPDSTIMYIWFEKNEDKSLWTQAINENLHIVIAQGWNAKAKLFRIKQTEDQLIQHRTSVKQ